MGRVVDFGRVEMSTAGEGVTTGPITSGDTREFTAELVRIAKGKSWRASAPVGSDLYLFTTKGAGKINAASYLENLPNQAYATIGEGVGFTVTAGSEPLELVVVTTPPKGAKRELAGFAAALDVKVRAREPVVDVADQKKKRIYFCGHHHGAETHRGHAMIVVYDRETYTALHHHPNAESMFVLIDGACKFTVNGKEAIVKAGQAAYFGIDDKHGLTTAPGESGASFLEFHIPSAFTTVKA